MSRPVPSLVVRPHDPARARRARLMLAVAWIGSLLLLAFVLVELLPATAGGDGAAVAPLRKENEVLKSRVAMLERSEQVARAALTDVQQTLRDREEEIAGVRADLAFYGRLVGGARREGLTVHGLRVERVGGSKAWNFEATLTQNFRRGKDSSGRLALAVEGITDGRLESLDWNRLTQEQGGAGVEFGFKYFQQVKGTIMLPDGFDPNRVRVTVDGDGGRVERDFSWKDALRGEETDDVRQ